MACLASDKALSIDQTPSSRPSHARISDNIGLLSTSACFCKQVHLFADTLGNTLSVRFIGADLFVIFTSSEPVGTEADRFDSELVWECDWGLEFGMASSVIWF